ncbi:alpha/beta hydrolase [Microbacterium abyssi]|uniref:esterase/lipase family protein n=1 Tax=Microbacterium abyssi TaxID=2782166 RepID=UPI002B274974|nr:alpha/beta hydrolase [Microbacterium sp. A18JL241]
MVVLPGVYESWKFLQPLIEQLHGRGHPVHVIETLRRNQRPVADAAVEVTAFLEAADLRDVVLVAHSKGGLAGKLVMVGPEAGRVASMLAVATPFSGSRYARMMPGQTLRAFSPVHPSILAIARHQDVNGRVVSVFGEFDPHIPEGSELVGARNVRLATGGHFRILAHPQVLVEFSALVTAGD